MSDENKDKDIIDEQIARVGRAMKGALSIREGAERLGITPLVAAVLCSVGGDRETREAAGFLLSEEVYKFGEKIMKTPFDLRKKVAESQDSGPKACPHGFLIHPSGEALNCPECP